MTLTLLKLMISLYYYFISPPAHLKSLPTAGFDETGGPHMFPGFNPNFDSFEEEMLADWTEDQKKEREVILGNRYVRSNC